MVCLICLLNQECYLLFSFYLFIYLFKLLLLNSNSFFKNSFCTFLFLSGYVNSSFQILNAFPFYFVIFVAKSLKCHIFGIFLDDFSQYSLMCFISH
jgi:hypothetical protein